MVLILVLLALARALPAAPQQGGVDVTAYSIDIVIEAERLVGTVEMAVSSPQAVERLALELASSVDLRSCQMGGRDVPFERSRWDLSLDLEAVGSPKGDFVLRFELDGKPYNKQRNKHIRTVISPEHAYIRSQYAWYPRRADDLATYWTRLSVRQGWTARTAGDLQAVERHGDSVAWQYSLQKPTSDIGLVAGEYVSVERSTDSGLKLDALVFDGHQPGAEVLLDVAGESISFFTALFGPMSESHFTLVQMPPAFGPGSGYGETGYALVGSAAFNNAAGAFWAKSLTTHEVSHTWWGREVLFSDFASEMLATYSTMRFNQQFHGEDVARDERRQFVKRVTATAAAKELVALDAIVGFGGGADPAVYSVCAYDKAAMLLFALELEMGRAAFDRALKKLFRSNRNRTLAYADVKKGLPSARHNWVFSQWETAEIPGLSLEYSAKKSGSTYRVKGTLRQQGTSRPFRMDVSLRAIAGDQSAEQIVKVRKAATTFNFKCAFRPESIAIDPDSHLVVRQAGQLDVQALSKAIFAVANSPKAADPVALRQAIANAREVINSGQEKDSVYHTAIGRCRFRLGELDAAKHEFETALEGGAGGPFHRAWIHLRLGCIADLKWERKAATSWYEKVLAASEARSHAYQKRLARRFLERAYRGYKQDG